MSEAMQIDVLVVGIGPAGAAAAWRAAAGGLSVLGVDRRREIGVPVQCAEFIPLPLANHAQRDGVIRQPIRGMKSYLPSGEVVSNDFPGLMIDRARFDQALAAKASEAGATLWLQSRLMTLDTARCMAWIQREDGRQCVQYRALIAADGPHSTVAQAMELPELDVVHTRQYTVPLLQPYEDTDIWLSDTYPGGYGWLFPKGQSANLGLGFSKQYGDDLKQALDALHTQLQKSGIVGAEIQARTGGAIPVGGLRPRLCFEHGAFVGDAAGLTHPITGAGIPAAVLSGERAGEAAIAALQHQDDCAWEDYEEDMRDQYETSLARAVARRRWMAQFWHTADAMQDAMHRKGWIAFREYFEQ